MPLRVSPSLVLIGVSCGLVAARAVAQEASPAPVAPAAEPAPSAAEAPAAPAPEAPAAPPALLATAAAPAPATAKPASVSFDDWSVRDRVVAEAPGLLGLAGTYRAIDAFPTAPGQFKLGLFADWYSGSFLCSAAQPCPNGAGGAPVTDSTTGHFGTSLALSFGLAQLGAGTLEGYAVTTASATSDTSGKPTLLQALGDTSLGFKYGARVAPAVAMGVLGGVDFVNGAGSVGLDGAATGGRLGGLLTFDGRELEHAAPVRVHFNAGYTFDNRAEVVSGTEATRGAPVSRFERLGLGAMRTDHADLSLAVEGLFADERVRPFLETSTSFLVNRQGYKCLRTNASGDKCLADSMVAPTRLTVGLRGQPIGNRAFSLLAAADIGIAGSSDFIEEAVPVFPWTVAVGASWNFDARERPPVIKESEKVVDRGPKGTRVVGRGVDAADKKPVANARVRVAGKESGPGYLAGADGTFRTDHVEAGQIELILEAEGFKPARCGITFPVPAQGQAPALEVAADCPLEALPAILTVVGTVRDMENGAPMTGVAVHVKDATGKTFTATTNEKGEYKVDGVMAGAFKVDAEPDGYLFTGLAAEGKARSEKTIDVYLRAKPKTSLVTLEKNEIAIKQQVQFDVNTAKILPESFALLAEIADVMARATQIKRIEVQGHTDNAGAPEYNQKLSEARAGSVRQWLVDHGIEATRLLARGYGESKPLVPNLTPSMKQKNRRVQFIIVE
jgi:outer membrane protein OmpA-like peptidoglycan-associated protein